MFLRFEILTETHIKKIAAGLTHENNIAEHIVNSSECPCPMPQNAEYTHCAQC